MTLTSSFQRKDSTNHALGRFWGLSAPQNIIWPIVVLAILTLGLAVSGRARNRGGAPVLTLSKSQLSFGSIAVGSSSTIYERITNTGNAPMTISSVVVSGSTFQISGINFPLTINPGGSHRFATAFAPTAAGTDSGTLIISSNATDPTVNVALTGTGTAAKGTGSPVLALGAASLSFGSVNVGTTATQSLSLSDSGSGALTITQASVSGAGFSISGLATPVTLNAGQITSLTVSFDPAAAGSCSGLVSIASNSIGSGSTVALSGTGLSVGSPVLGLSPASLSFGSVNVGTATTKTVSLTNSGSAALTISNASVSGTGFSISGLSTPVTLNAGQSTSLTVSFDPAAAGNSVGSISITSNSTGSASTVALSGTGVSLVLNVTPSSVSFGSVATGTSNSQTITLSNAGVVSLTISQALVSGSGMSMTGMTAPLTIAAGKTSSFNVVFDPAASGAVAGSVTLVSNATDSPLSIALSGTGTVSTQLLSVSPASLSFGNVTDGSTSQLSDTLTNTGTSNVTISSVGASGTGFSLTSPTSSVTLAPGQSVTVTAQFAPVNPGSDTGALTVVSTATNSPTSVALSGSGVAAVNHSVSLGWTPSTSTVVGYNIYRETQSSGQYVMLNTTSIAGTSFTDSAVTAGQTYSYYAKSVDSSGNLSVESNIATATVPTP